MSEVMNPDIETSPDQYLMSDRYDDSEYLVDQPTYLYIMDLITFYHQNIYEFPDEDLVHVEKIDQENTHSECDIPINRLVFH